MKTISYLCIVHLNNQMAELVDALRFISGVFGICIDLIRTGSNPVLITNLKSNYLKTEWFETFGLIMVYGAQ